MYVYYRFIGVNAFRVTFVSVTDIFNRLISCSNREQSLPREVFTSKNKKKYLLVKKVISSVKSSCYILYIHLYGIYHSSNLINVGSI